MTNPLEELDNEALVEYGEENFVDECVAGNMEGCERWEKYDVYKAELLRRLNALRLADEMAETLEVFMDFPAKWHDTMMDDLANYLQARKGEQ